MSEETQYPTGPCECGHSIDSHCTYHLLDNEAEGPEEIIQWHECMQPLCDCEGFWRKE
jgi:hypothetical protein